MQRSAASARPDGQRFGEDLAEELFRRGAQFVEAARREAGLGEPADAVVVGAVEAEHRSETPTRRPCPR